MKCYRSDTQNIDTNGHRVDKLLPAASPAEENENIQREKYYQFTKSFHYEYVLIRNIAFLCVKTLINSTDKKSQWTAIIFFTRVRIHTYKLMYDKNKYYLRKIVYNDEKLINIL